MLLSRVADALYWISRYLERAEHTARLVDVARDLGLDRAAAVLCGPTSIPYPPDSPTAFTTRLSRCSSTY